MTLPPYTIAPPIEPMRTIEYTQPQTIGRITSDRTYINAMLTPVHEESIARMQRLAKRIGRKTRPTKKGN